MLLPYNEPYEYIRPSASTLPAFDKYFGLYSSASSASRVYNKLPVYPSTD